MQEEIDWVTRLKAAGVTRDSALEELRHVLLRGLSRSLARRGGGDAFADDVVQESLVKILAALDSFAGRSRFTTWAMTIANRLAISELRRRHFQDVSLDQIASDDDLNFDVISPETVSPTDHSEREELLIQLRDLIQNELTERQRTVIQAALGGMPIEEIARRMNANRNSIYKLFHDARKKIRSGFEADGVSGGDIQALLG